MVLVTWVVGLAISLWVGSMGVGSVLQTASAKAWFGDKLKQSETLMRINGLGLTSIAAIILLNLIAGQAITSYFVMWALIGLIVSQLSALFMLQRGGESTAAKAGPIVLLTLAILYWFIRV